MSDTVNGNRITAHAASDVGQVRQQNEDSLFAGTTVFAVADGMGGHQAGEVASDLALEPLRALDGQAFASAGEVDEALAEAVVTANGSVVEKAESDPDFRGMGTTLTAVCYRDGRLHLAHVGDSRAYLLRPGHDIHQLTTDHTVVEQLIREGRLDPGDAATHPQRSVITRAVGVEREIEVDSLSPLELLPGDQVLLCSDGLTGPVDDARIAEILEEHEDGDAACRALIDAANEGGGPDNITVVLLRVVGAADAAAVPVDDEEPTQEFPATEPDGADAHGTAGTAGAGSHDGHDAGGANGNGTGQHTVTQIRTRHETGQDWASSMGRYGAPQGVEHRGPQKERSPSGPGRRVLAALLAVVVLVGIVAGGGYFLLSRAYFVGDAGGTLAIYNGLPQQVAGVELYWIAEETDLETEELPFRIQPRVREGVTVGSLTEGRRLVERYRDEVEAEEAAEDPDPAAEDPDPAADDPDPAAEDPDAGGGDAGAEGAADE